MVVEVLEEGALKKLKQAKERMNRQPKMKLKLGKVLDTLEAFSKLSPEDLDKFMRMSNKQIKQAAAATVRTCLLVPL